MYRAVITRCGQCPSKIRKLMANTKRNTTARRKAYRSSGSGSGAAKATSGGMVSAATTKKNVGRKAAKGKAAVGKPGELVIKKMPRKRNGTVRVLSWNIQGTHDSASALSAGANKRSAKVKTVAKVVAQAEPDLMILQEVAGGKTSVFEKELRKALPKGYTASSSHDQPQSKGQRYLTVHKTDTKVSFGSFDDFSKTSLSKKKLQPFDENVAKRSRKPATIEVKMGTKKFRAATWHAPHGGLLEARSANQQYSSHLSATKKSPDVFVGDLNIKSGEVRTTYGLNASSMSSKKFDHVISMGGKQVTTVTGLPTLESLKAHFGWQVSDHSMVGGDVEL